MSEYLKIEAVGKVFDTRKGPYTALSNINLLVEEGEFVSLIGHSGCGKSTLLNLVAGLILPSAGNMILAGREIAGPGPDRGVVFQNHSLLPWLTIGEILNIDLPRPRERLELSTNPRYMALRTQVLQFLYQKQMKVAA